MSQEEPPGRIRIQEQPWWTSGTRYALLFIVASNLAVLATIFVPEISHWRDRHLQQAISESDRRQQSELAAASRKLETLNRQVEVTRLLFDHFFGKSAKEQRAVVTYLTYQFPQDLGKKSLQAILFLEAKPTVTPQIAKSVAAVRTQRSAAPNVAAIDVAIANERLGFSSLAAGKVAGAARAFAVAYEAYPTYHNVDEISRQVLTPAAVARYEQTSPDARRALLKDMIDVILSKYSWGIPPDLRAPLKRAAGR